MNCATALARQLNLGMRILRTSHTIACIMASSPPSGESKLPEILEASTASCRRGKPCHGINVPFRRFKLTLNLGTTSVRGSALIKLYGGTHPVQGSLILKNMRLPDYIALATIETNVMC